MGFIYTVFITVGIPHDCLTAQLPRIPSFIWRNAFASPDLLVHTGLTSWNDSVVIFSNQLDRVEIHTVNSMLILNIVLNFELSPSNITRVRFSSQYPLDNSPLGTM